MTHEEYLAQCESFGDSDAGTVLAHVAACAVCRRDERRSERALSRLEPK